MYSWEEVSRDLLFDCAAIIWMMKILLKDNKDNHSVTGILAAATAEHVILGIFMFYDLPV